MNYDNATRIAPARQANGEAPPDSPAEIALEIDRIAGNLRAESYGVPRELREVITTELGIASRQAARAEDGPRWSELSGICDALGVVTAVYAPELGRELRDVAARAYGMALERWTP